MPALLETVDPDGLEEFSVVFTDRSLNHMSMKFQKVMRDLSDGLKEVYQADGVAIVPGGGSPGGRMYWWCAMDGFPIAGARSLKQAA